MSATTQKFGLIILGTTFALFAGTWHDAGIQDAETSQSRSDLEARVTQLEQRVAELEKALRLDKRVSALEQARYATRQLTIDEALQRVGKAEAALKNSEKLLAKGYVSDAQHRIMRYDLERARAELELAASGKQGDIAASGVKLKILGAEQRLEQAKLQLNHTRKLFERGFAARPVLNRAEWEVQTAQRQLEIAKEQLEQLKKIEPPEKSDDSYSSSDKKLDSHSKDDQS